MRPDLKFYAHYAPEQLSFNIYIRAGENHVGQPMHVELVEFDTARSFVEPTVRLPRHEAQALFQAMWDAGLRPNDGEGTSGHVAALKYHLEDMRRLVFKEKK